ncbi:MAG: shikimate dehydrogenase, partial [Candidatus Dormiibacterota bacterium]
DGNAAMAEALDGAELLVNATTLGGPLFPQLSPVSDLVELHSDLIVFDLIYWPPHTPLRRRAQAEGCVLVEGLEMLVEQGALAFQAWTGMNPPLVAMREAANRAVEVIR